MAKKKSTTKKRIQKESVMDKIASNVGHFAGELVAGKNHLVEMAGDTIDSLKTTIQNITATKKATPKRTVKAKAKRAVTKTAPATAKKTAKPNAVKKAAPAKKVIKKVAKKARGKK